MATDKYTTIPSTTGRARAIYGLDAPNTYRNCRQRARLMLADFRCLLSDDVLGLLQRYVEYYESELGYPTHEIEQAERLLRGALQADSAFMTWLTQTQEGHHA